MKLFFTSVAILISTVGYHAQELYRDFETVKKVVFAEWSGVMDSTSANTLSNGINPSLVCGKYIRDTAMYDNFKMFPLNPLVDVTPYTDTAVAAPRLSMKVRTSAPVGSIIKIQLGSRSVATFPQGVHSEYTATTTVTNAWELLTFKFWQKPANGYTVATSIDKIVVFIRPGSTVKDTVYFDDPMGPEVLVLGVRENSRGTGNKLSQNKPNPAAEATSIGIILNSPQVVTLDLTDVAGRKVSTIVSGYLDKGAHTLQLDTREIPNGVYYYTLKMEGYSQTRRMIIAR
jgi:hypothetical protein